MPSLRFVYFMKPSVAPARRHEGRANKRLMKERKEKGRRGLPVHGRYKYGLIETSLNIAAIGIHIESQGPPSLLGRYFRPFNIVISEPADVIDPRQRQSTPRFSIPVTSLCESCKRKESANRVSAESPPNPAFISVSEFASSQRSRLRRRRRETKHKQGRA